MRNPTLKLACYLVVTLLSALASELEPLNAEAVAGWTWLEWLKLAIAVCIPTALVWRAFVDQSLSNPPTPTVTVSTAPPTQPVTPQPQSLA